MPLEDDATAHANTSLSYATVEERECASANGKDAKPQNGGEAKREEGEKECPGEVVGSRHLSWQNPADIEEGPRKPTHVREQQGSLRWN